MENKVMRIKTIKSNQSTTQAPKLLVAAYCRVSTDDTDQLASLQSQKEYYEKKIQANPEWKLSEIYYDEAVTGTKVSKRLGFQKMIQDCKDSKINLIITKSISRFARNTVDLLEYVRMLKELDIAVLFEEENINTLTMDGELLLTILSSVAQQEVTNTSEHIRTGLKMKLERGELIGNNNCYGYRYDKTTKQVYIIEDEARVVQYIFEQYANGYGAQAICNKLQDNGIKTKKGNTIWQPNCIIDIIRNVKYKGDCLFGRTYIIDAITKKRTRNQGLVDQYIIEGHHEPIVTEELFDAANKILAQRSAQQKFKTEGPFLDFSGKYTLSKRIKCAYCGSSFSRRKHQQTQNTYKATWRCIRTCQQGVHTCPNSKVIDEAIIQKAFVAIINSIHNTDRNLLLSISATTKKQIADTLPRKNEENTKTAIKALEVQKSKLVDLVLEGTIKKDDYQLRINDIDAKIKNYQKDLDSITDTKKKLNSLDTTLDDILDVILSKEELKEYDDQLLEALVKGIIIGGEDDPYRITFVFSKHRANLPEHMEIIPFKTIELPYTFHSFEKNDKGYLQRVNYKSITISAAIEQI